MHFAPRTGASISATVFSFLLVVGRSVCWKEQGGVVSEATGAQEWTRRIVYGDNSRMTVCQTRRLQNVPTRRHCRSPADVCNLKRRRARCKASHHQVVGSWLGEARDDLAVVLANDEARGIVAARLEMAEHLLYSFANSNANLDMSMCGIVGVCALLVPRDAVLVESVGDHLLKLVEVEGRIEVFDVISALVQEFFGIIDGHNALGIFQ